MKIGVLSPLLLVVAVVALTSVNEVESATADEVRKMLDIASSVFAEQLKSDPTWNRSSSKTQCPKAPTSPGDNGDWQKYHDQTVTLAVMKDEMVKLKAEMKRRIRDLEADYNGLMSHANEITDEEQKKAVLSQIEGQIYNYKQLADYKKLIEDSPSGGQQSPQTPGGAMAGADGQPGHPGGAGMPGPGMPPGQPGGRPSAGPGSDVETAGEANPDEEESGGKKHGSKKGGSKKGKDKKKHGKHDKHDKHDKKGKGDKKGKKPSRSHKKNKKKNDRSGKGKH